MLTGALLLSPTWVVLPHLAGLPAQRGIEVDSVTLSRWEQRVTPLQIDAARPLRHLAADR